MYNIKINFEQKGLEPVLLQNIPSGDFILEALLDNDIELHHNCGGVCACSTCHIYIDRGEEFIKDLSDKEEDFIDRAVKIGRAHRLNSSHLKLSRMPSSA